MGENIFYVLDFARKWKKLQFWAISAIEGPLESPFRDPKGPPSFATPFLIFQYQISFKLDQSHVFLLIRLEIK